MNLTPLALYIHIPFCLRRCDYCGFVSSVYEQKQADAYLEALALEIKQRAAGMAPRTVYIGGGTPTCLNADQMTQLFDSLAILPLANVVEWTIEANPGTLTREKLELLQARGINRVSLGIQTFHAHGLFSLGRRQDNLKVKGTIAQLREMGIENISADLIYGWAGQKPEEWQSDLAEVLRLRLPHVSCYSLVYEDDTPLAHRRVCGQITPLSEEEERQLFDLTSVCLAKGGLHRYEISNFSIPGWECRHNLVYWRGEEYIGVGAAAHSHVYGVRYANVSAIAEYVSRMTSGRSPVASEERLTPERKARECAVIWLRLRDGIDTAAFAQRTGYTLQDLYNNELPRLLADGWLTWSPDKTRLHLTDKALPLADFVLAELV